MSEENILFEVKNINKHFGPTHANKNVSLQLKKGELHGLIGENGSGKSTLISIMAGINQADSGEMFMNGQLYKPNSPLDAAKHDIGFVVQELGLLDTLPVAANIFLGHFDRFTVAGVLKLRKMYIAAAEELKKWGFSDISVRAMAGLQTVEKRKIVEIVKALLVEPQLLILDETTQALSHDTRKRLHEIINELLKQGKTILMITHDIEEIAEVADRVTVLRDGEIVGCLNKDEIDPSKLKRMMVGREIGGELYRTDHETIFEDKIVLEARNLGLENYFSGVSFELHKGEILGICGLSDGGIHELGKTLVGIEKATTGNVLVTETNTVIKSASDATKADIAYLPKDRDSEALMMGAAIAPNLYVPSLNEIEQKFGYISHKKCNELAQKALEKFDVRCLGIRQAISSLSGGNKQKISLGKWLIKDLKIMVLDCPTRGVDVAVKAYIYDLMKELKTQGLSIILISDEMPEVMGLSDRLLIMKNGKIAGIMERSETFEEGKIIEVMI